MLAWREPHPVQPDASGLMRPAGPVPKTKRTAAHADRRMVFGSLLSRKPASGGGGISAAGRDGAEVAVLHAAVFSARGCFPAGCLELGWAVPEFLQKSLNLVHDANPLRLAERIQSGGSSIAELVSRCTLPEDAIPSHPPASTEKRPRTVSPLAPRTVAFHELYCQQASLTNF